MSKENQNHQEIFRAGNERIARWRKANPTATLTEIEREIEQELKGIREQWVTAIVHESQAVRPTDREHCPQCQTEMINNGIRQRKLQGRDGTEIAIEREQLRCPSCGMTVFPPR